MLTYSAESWDARYCTISSFVDVMLVRRVPSQLGVLGM